MNRTWLGVGIVVILALALVLVLASSGDGVPATTTAAPTAAPTTASRATTPSTTSAPPTTTTTAAPTTTLDPEARAVEIEALVRDLELQLLQAVFDQDEVALAEAVGGKGLWEALQPSFNEPEAYFALRPSSDRFRLTLNEVLLDRGDCIVANVDEDATAFYLDYDQVDEWVAVLWRMEDSPRGWRIAELWASGTPSSEWMRNCDLQDR